jgi:aspartyl-tRNA(Asn)/glutamyl-tRNA(Gln) amidotransferase subunit C
LSKLKFSEEEREIFKNEFSNIVAFVNEIATLDLPDEFSKANAVPLSSLREDEAKCSISQEAALQNAPKQKDGCYVTPLVID